MKIIDTKSYLDTLCELADKNKTVSVVVSGSSMTPFLTPSRDTVFLQKLKKSAKKGDILLFVRKNGDYILHRVKKVTPEGYYFLGDRQIKTEGPVPKENIRCIVTAAKRKDKLITKKNFIWKFYSKIWINLVFLRPVIFKLRGRKKKNKQKGDSL